MHYRTTLSGYIFTTKALSTVEKNFLNSNISSTYPHDMMNFGPLRLRSLGEFGVPQQISTGFASWLRYCTDVAQRRSTKLCTMFGRLLGWCTIYAFWGFCPLTEFCQVQNSLCVQVLRSPILAALLHGTRAVGISQTLRRGIFTRQGGYPFRH